MKNVIKTFICLAVFIISTHALARDFIQASLSTGQAGGKNVLVKLNTIDAARGLKLSNNAIRVNKSGYYFVMVAPQVGGARGYADFWLENKEGKIPNSGVRVQYNGKTQKDVIVSQGISYLAKGDELKVKMSTSNPKLGLEAFQPGSGTRGARIPGIIFTMFSIH